MTQGSPRTSRLQKPLLALAACGFALAIAETGLRVADVDLNRQPHLRYDRAYGWLAEPGFQGIDRINRDGFRGADTRGPKAPGAKRLLVLGDSFAFAGAQPYSLTFPGLLEEWLRDDRRHRWEVASLSIPDWGTAQELIALRRLGLDYEPDVVVLQVFPYNDLCNNTLELANVCGALQDRHRPYFVVDDAGDLRRRPLSRWATTLRISRLFGLAEEASIALRRRGRTQRQVAAETLRAAGVPEHWARATGLIPEDRQPPTLQRGWDVTERIFHEIATAATERGAFPLAVTIPYSHTFDPTWVAQQEVAGIPIGATADTDIAAKLLHRAGIPNLSMRELIAASALPPSSFFLPDNPHLSDLGHAHVAKWLMEELVRRGHTAAAPPELDYRVAADLMEDDEPMGFAVEGLTPIRSVGDKAWRFGLGPETTLEFGDTRSRAVVLSFSAVGLFPGQEFGIEVNGRTVHHVPELPVQRSALAESVTFSTAPGRNTIVLRYKDWNRRSTEYLPGESRDLAVKFVRLALQETGSGTGG